MAKKRSAKKTGVKGLHLPTLVTYIVAGIGVIFIIIFLGYLFSKSGPSRKEIDPKEKQRWEQVISDFKNKGVLLSFEKSKDKEDEGAATVDLDLWNKLPYDTKETMCLAVTKESGALTLFLKTRDGVNLGIYRAGGRFYENKNL